MRTITKRNYSAISNDARAVYEAASEDQSEAAMRKRISAKELAAFLGSIEALEESGGASASLGHAQVLAGEGAAAASRTLVLALRTLRDDAKLVFGRTSRQARAYGAGVGRTLHAADNPKRVADLVLATAHSQGRSAARVGLDAAGIRRLKELVLALEDAEQEHAAARLRRHMASQSVVTAAHTVAAEVARVRLAASVAFRNDPSKLDRYRVALPRHTPRSREPAPPPPGPPEPAPVTVHAPTATVSH